MSHICKSLVIEVAEQHHLVASLACTVDRQLPKNVKSEKCLIESYTGTGRFVKFGNILSTHDRARRWCAALVESAALDDVETRLVWTGQLQCRA